MTRPIGPFHHNRPDPRKVPLHEGERRRIAAYLRGGLTLRQTANLTGVSIFTLQVARRALAETNR